MDTTRDTGPRPRPPATAVAAIVVLGLYSILGPAAKALGLPGAQLGEGGRFWLPATACLLVVLTWRRHAVGWGLVVGGGLGLGVFFGVTFGVVGGMERDWGLLSGAAILGLVPLLFSLAYLRRPVRAWFGFACHACGAFRWRMNSPATQAPCRRCGAPYGSNP